MEVDCDSEAVLDRIHVHTSETRDHYLATCQTLYCH